MSGMKSSTEFVAEQIEQLAIERTVIVLRAKVRSLPVNDEDGLWVKTMVLRFLDEATTAREGAPPPSDALSPTTAAARSTAPQGEPAGNGRT